MNLFDRIELEVAQKTEFAVEKDVWMTYLQEARWGWELIASLIHTLPPNSSILEIGAGPQILSLQIATLNHSVTCLEPSTEEFSFMLTMGKYVKNWAEKSGVNYNLLEIKGEEFSQPNFFDFAFSINVMEHVESIETVLDNVVDSLKSGGTYYFICPNYTFPFEPHFRSFTLINKKLTELLVKRFAISKSNVEKPELLWRSLNWINWKQIDRWAQSRDDLQIKYEKSAVKFYLERSRKDSVFIKRHPLLSTGVSKFHALVALVLNIMPKRFIPILEVTITRTGL